MAQSRRGHNEGWHLLTEDAAMADSSPTMRRRQLGAELRHWREACGKRLTEAADWIGIDESGMSRVETGKRTVSLGNVRSLLDLYDVGSPERDELLSLAKDAQQRTWLAEFGTSVPERFRRFLGMEDATEEIWAYEGFYPPGLLQTRGYLDAAAATNPAFTPERIERLAELRVVRQRRLVHPPTLKLRAVLDQAVVERQVGGPEVMQEQLRGLLDAAQLPNVMLHILPFGLGAHPGMTGSFTLLRFPQEEMTTVYIELERAALYLEKPAEVARYAATFDRLVQLALGREETINLLKTKIERNPR